MCVYAWEKEGDRLLQRPLSLGSAGLSADAPTGSLPPAVDSCGRDIALVRVRRALSLTVTASRLILER